MDARALDDPPCIAEADELLMQLSCLEAAMHAVRNGEHDAASKVWQFARSLSAERKSDALISTLSAVISRLEAEKRGSTTAKEDIEVERVAKSQFTKWKGKVQELLDTAYSLTPTDLDDLLPMIDNNDGDDACDVAFLKVTQPLDMATSVPSFTSAKLPIGKANYHCKCPGCPKSNQEFTSTSAVRKHCRCKHEKWYASLGGAGPESYCSWVVLD